MDVAVVHFDAFSRSSIFLEETVDLGYRRKLRVVAHGISKCSYLTESAGQHVGCLTKFNRSFLGNVIPNADESSFSSK